MKTELISGRDLLLHFDVDSHWYWPDGRLCTEVPNSKGEMIKPTRRHARKYGLLPSVTNILNAAPEPYPLRAWKDGQLVMSALTLSREPEESDDQFLSRIREDADQHAMQAAAFGQLVHAIFAERLLRKIGDDQRADSFLAKIDSVIEPDGTVNYELFRITANITPFRSFAEKLANTIEHIEAVEKRFANIHLGYAGTVDIIGELAGRPVIIDLKTRSSSNERELFRPRIKDGMQLAGYRRGLGPEYSGHKLINILIPIHEPARAMFHEWDEAQSEALKASFIKTHELWLSPAFQDTFNVYDPKETIEEN